MEEQRKHNEILSEAMDERNIQIQIVTSCQAGKKFNERK